MASTLAPIEIGVREARANFSHYLARAREGVPVIIRARGAAAVQLRLANDVIPDPRLLRQPGWLKGGLRMADDFDDWPADIAAAFERPLE